MTRPTRLLWLLAFALFARAMIPVGWMPSAVPGQIVMLCTDAGLERGWVDAEGKLHKSDPGTTQHDQSPCAFAGLGAAVDAPDAPMMLTPNGRLTLDAPSFPASVDIGQGLAAPPPPKTGPPLKA